MAFKLSDINSIRPVVRAGLRYVTSGSALDLGCGVGRHALFLAKKGFTVTAVDQRSENIAALKELARIQKLPIVTHKLDVTAYEPKKKFDFIVVTMLLHFLPYRVQRQCISMMQNYTKKHGIHVISNYSDKNKKGTRPHLVRAPTLKRHYIDAGWRILYYKERRSDPMTTSADSSKTVRYWIAELIAQKP